MPVDAKAAKAIFMAALDKIEPAERAAYLAEACGSDDALRLRVEVLLKAHDDPSSFMKVPDGDLLATVDEPVTGGLGTLIGPYKLLEQIGEGGFGVVFMAEQTRPVRRKVALKVLKPGMDSKQVVARFEAERQALALMDHPNIARVLDAGQTDSGRPYFVMELVKGLPITDYCDQNQFTPQQRLGLFVSVCQAVQHAHQKGVIHRDLKPSNVLVTVQDGAPLVKVIDFGIAKALGQPLTDKTLFTGFAQLVGTPLYMSPEQAAFSNADVDTRSDIYSLGVLLYELLTGTTPFDKKRLKEVGYDELRRIVREEEAPRPSTRLSTLGKAATAVCENRRCDPKQLRELLRCELDWVVIKALEKDRNRRYETALELADDIRRYLHNDPVLACPPTMRYRLRKLLRKHRGLIAAAATVLAVLLGGIGATTAAYLRARDAETEARQAEAEARATVDFLTYDVFGVDPPDARGGRAREVTIRQALDAAAPKVNPALGHDPRVEAAVRHVLGTTYRFLGDYEAARFQLEQAVAIRRRVLGEGDPATLSSQHSFCTLLHDQGRLDEAEVLCRAVLGARRRRLPAGDVGIPSSLTLLGLILTDKGEPERAEPVLREALDLFGKALAEGHWRTANAQALLGECLRAQGRYADAEPLLLAACRTLLDPPGAPRHHTRRAVELTVRLYEAWGKNGRAEEWRQKLAGLSGGD